MLKFGSWTYGTFRLSRRLTTHSQVFIFCNNFADDKQVNVSLGDPAVIDGNYVANGEWSIVGKYLLFTIVCT